MTYNPEVHHRRSIRLPNYDYRQPGSYFITVCTQNRVCWLGNIADGVMTLNTAGDIVRSVWLSLPARFPMVELDACVVMPNHVHGIIHTHATPP